MQRVCFQHVVRGRRHTDILDILDILSFFLVFDLLCVPWTSAVLHVNFASAAWRDTQDLHQLQHPALPSPGLIVLSLQQHFQCQRLLTPLQAPFHWLHWPVPGAVGEKHISEVA